jgi:hypothetical protein
VEAPGSELEEQRQRLLLAGFLARGRRRRALRQNTLDIRLEIRAGLLKDRAELGA